MIIVMKPNATDEQLNRVKEVLSDLGYKVHPSQGEERSLLGAVGKAKKPVDVRDLKLLPGVGRVLRVAEPYKLVNRLMQPEGTMVDVAGVRIGGDELVVIAGPCAVESRDQMRRSAAVVRAAGATILRGGAFKPRSSPYSFQGLGEEGLRYLREAADEQGMGCVTEVVDPADVELVASYADMLQIGARNMQNFRLLAAVGAVGKPVLLKRGLAATLEELLMSAEYIAAAGSPNVVLCERGVRTFEPKTRNTMDLSAIPVLRELTHLPIIADPSHATGVRAWVAPMARAAVAAGADGIIVEVHPEPDKALCDGAQSLTPPGIEELVAELRIIAPAVRRRLPGPPRELHRKLKEPIFETACLVGVGLMGASLALSLRESGAVKRLVGVDRADQVTAVRSAGVVDEVRPLEELSEAVKGADLVVLAAPVRNIIEQLEQIAPHLAPGTVVTDVGSTKVRICAAADLLPKGVHFIGGHPVAGSERRGAAAADPLLFHDAAWLLCPTEAVPEEATSKLRRVIESLGAHPLGISAERHDRLAAAVSHVPHLVAAALSNSVGRLGLEDDLAPRMAAGGFRSVTRTASSPFEVWGDILATNRGPIRERLAAFRDALDRIDEALEEETPLKLELDEAARHRTNVPRGLPGVHRAEGELIVRVVDEPGALAAVATALAREQLNIQDLEILKVRQFEDGVLRVAFENQKETTRAAEVLRRAGHDVRMRTDAP